MAKKLFYIVLATDGREVCGSEEYEGLEAEADKVGGAVVDSLGNILFVSELAGASDESADPADPSDSALLDSTPEAAESEGDGTDG